MPRIPPVIVDADFLLRQVDSSVSNGWTPRLLQATGFRGPVASGVAVFATTRVQQEVERHLQDVAHRRRVDERLVTETWETVFLPRIAFVDLGGEDIDDPRIAEVRQLHDSDRPTATLAIALAPSLLLTDNRKHFRPLELPDPSAKQVALDVFTLNQYFAGVDLAAFLSEVSGLLVVEGSKRVVSKLGRRDAAILGLLLIGGLALWWISESGVRFRTKTQVVVAPLADTVGKGLALQETVMALAIEPATSPVPMRSLVMRELAVGPAEGISTVQIAQLIRDHGYRLSGEGGLRTRVRAWLKNQACFSEIRRGWWTVGHRARD